MIIKKVIFFFINQFFKENDLRYSFFYIKRIKVILRNESKKMNFEDLLIRFTKEYMKKIKRK